MIQFKDARCEQDFATLAMRNLRLWRIAQAASDFCEHEFNKPCVITCVFRTPEENAALYAPNPQPDWRPHTEWCAFDLRSSIYTAWEIARLLSFLENYYVWGGKKKCAVYHKIPGNVMHFHVQADPTPTLDEQRSGAV